MVELSKYQNKDLLNLLQIFEELFTGTLGTWKTDPADFEQEENSKPLCLQPKLHKEIFRGLLKQFVLLVVLIRVQKSNLEASYSIQPKPKKSIMFSKQLNKFK